MNKLFLNKKKLKYVNIVLEIVLVFCTYWIATLIRFSLPLGKNFAIFDSVIYMSLAFIFTLLVVLVSYLSGVYFTFHSSGLISEIKSSFKCVMVGFMADCTLIYFCHMDQFSRVLMVYFGVLSFLFIVVKRILLSKLVDRYKERNKAYNKVLLIGSGEEALKVYKTILEPMEFGLRLEGYIAKEQNKDIPAYIGDYSIINSGKLLDDIYMVMVVDNELGNDALEDIVFRATNHGIRVCISPNFSRYMLSKNGAFSLHGMNFCELTALETCDIMGVNISVTNMEKTVEKVIENLDKWQGKYICISNVHTTVTASENAEYKEIQNKAVFALPDGGPLSAFSREQGYEGAARVTGPDLMREILIKSKENGWRHLFYGSTQETLDKLKTVVEERYPGTIICDMISPPFRLLTASEDEEMVNRINKANPDFIWVGLGAPKQEIWMAAHENRVNGLMIGVGAAFDYESGNIKRAPKWMQKCNLEWLYRLMQDPKRLFKRYFITNTKYLIWKFQHGQR